MRSSPPFSSASPSLRTIAALAIGAALASPALAQRSSENAVRSAEDAFGSSVGNERVGLYSAQNARGFNPLTAGNVRIEGMYFDVQSALSERLFAGSTMRVGLTAQGYPFTSPSGIADFSIRKPTGQTLLSSTINANSFGEIELELDGQLKVSSSIELAGGISGGLEQLPWGGERPYQSIALIPRWRPSDGIDLIAFWTVVDAWDGDTQLVAFPAGDFFPPRMERRRNVSPRWAQSDARVTTFGALATIQSGTWTVKGGLFRTLQTSDWSFTDLSRNTDREGFGDRYIVAEKDRRTGSYSGEIRASRLIPDGDRRHLIHFTLRGRDARRRVGSTQSLFVGRLHLSDIPNLDRPNFVTSPHSLDHVRQLTAGIGYHGLWQGVGELSLGVQKTRYRKNTANAAGPAPELKSDPWLMNGMLSIHASKRLALYAGYSSGLEDSPTAPLIATNRDEAPPAIRITQIDGGVRWAVTDRVRLIAGAFQIEKPYYGLDPGLLYRNLGALRNRGAEFSLITNFKRVNLVLGLVLMNPTISGDAVDRGTVGPRPVDSFKRYANANVEYHLPWVRGLSVDLRYENYGNRAANRANTFVIPARHVVNPGLRYRTKIGRAPTTVRFQLASATNHYSPVLFGEGFVFNVPRRLTFSMTTDW